MRKFHYYTCEQLFQCYIDCYFEIFELYTVGSFEAYSFIFIEHDTTDFFEKDCNYIDISFEKLNL